MHGIRPKLEGELSGRLLVVEKAAFKDKNGNQLWWCLCECNNIVLVRTTPLVKKSTKSCGCLAKEIASIFHTKNRKANNCPHTNRKHRALGLCNACYLAYNGGSKVWYKNNTQKAIDNASAWNRNNPEKHNAANKKHQKNNENARLSSRLRNRILMAIKKSKKSKSTMALVGCTLKELRNHLEKKFKDGMTWENYGRNGWHIDHIVPCARFDLSKPEQQVICFHYTNLQPLWAFENLSKGAR